MGGGVNSPVRNGRRRNGDHVDHVVSHTRPVLSPVMIVSHAFVEYGGFVW